MSTAKPYYRRHRPAPTVGEAEVDARGKRVDFAPIPTPAYEGTDLVGDAAGQRDNRAACVVAAAVGLGDVDSTGKPKLRARSTIFWDSRGLFSVPMEPYFHDYDLCEYKWYGPGTGRFLMRGKALAVAAYQDYFPDTAWTTLRPFLSAVIPTASWGYCGTFGPGVDAATDLLGSPPEGNYDMNQMHLIPLAYAYYDELTPAAREHLIQVLLARGRIHRPRRPDQNTSGGLPNDWSRAGFVSPLGAHKNIGETENHILMMLTTRYLTNQLLYQRDWQVRHDNRRNGSDDSPSCFELVLTLLRNILRGDFSEYNAKNYQEETRGALLNLHSYAYDHEVRLAARMVLDYVSAKMAVSQSDLRRMIPFRRRNEGTKSARYTNGFMWVSLLATDGADPMGPWFAVEAGNLRSSVARQEGTVPVGLGGMKASTGEYTVWGIPGSGQDLVLEAVTDYRIPPSILDLFVNDRHRRFYQRLHRTPKPSEVGGNRNADNMEVYAGSPSYLITAGGAPATWAIDPKFAGFVMGSQSQQLGVAVPTTFMPTTGVAGSQLLMDRAVQLVQLGSFSAQPPGPLAFVSAANYGVAPDFACGHQLRMPVWLGPANEAGFTFVDRRSAMPGHSPGFYLAILRHDGITALEALDTWLHPEVSFADFTAGVLARNGAVQLASNQTTTWHTWNGNRVDFVVWNSYEQDLTMSGAKVLSVAYGGVDVADAVGDAGNTTNRFLAGTVMASNTAGLVDVRNPALATSIRLDLRNRTHPRRTDESGRMEWAGDHEEVWADFDWAGAQSGDVAQPMATMAAAEALVDEGGTVRMVPSDSTERTPIGASGKYFRMFAPIGGVTIG